MRRSEVGGAGGHPIIVVCNTCNMSGLDASFPINVMMVSRHATTVYKTRRNCSLCPAMASWSVHDVMMFPNFMAAVKRNGVRWEVLLLSDVL